MWTPRALERTESAARRIADQRPSAAREWIEALFAAARGLRDFPKRGRIVPEVNRAEIREILVGSYRVIYRLDPRRVAILTVRHQRRRWDREEIEQL